jgi:hypothetical protein
LAPLAFDDTGSFNAESLCDVWGYVNFFNKKKVTSVCVCVCVMEGINLKVKIKNKGLVDLEDVDVRV